MIGNSRIKIIKTAFVVVSRAEFATSDSATMSRMIEAIKKRIPIISFLLTGGVVLGYEASKSKVRQ